MMSCCGGKRKVWTEQSKFSAQAVSEIKRDIVVDKLDKVFEYIGNTSLTLTGAVTGKKYYFTAKGIRLPVSYVDSFAFMAEPDLKKSEGSEVDF